MNITEIFCIIENFFDLIHPNFCDDYVEEDNEFNLWKICEEFFEQIGPQI